MRFLKQNKLLLIGVGAILISSILSLMNTQSNPLLCVQYVTLAYGVSLLSCAIMKSYKCHHHVWLYGLGVLLLLFYTILTLDTFLFHAMHWFPGILRYPLYSLYGLPYLIFCLPGFLLCYRAK